MLLRLFKREWSGIRMTYLDTIRTFLDTVRPVAPERYDC